MALSSTLISNSDDTSGRNLDNDPLSKALLTYLQEQEQKAESCHRSFLEEFRQSLTQFNVELVVEFREPKSTQSIQPLSSSSLTNLRLTQPITQPISSSTPSYNSPTPKLYQLHLELP